MKGILAVSGKPGLFKLVSSMKNGLLVESIADGKREPVYGSQKVLSLEDISIYTSGDDMPLGQVIDKIFDFEKGGASIDARKASNDELRDRLGKALPEFDRDRVYVSDIKKLFMWYNQLHEKGLLIKEEEAKKEETVAEEAPKKAAKKKKDEPKADEPVAEAKPKKAPKKKAE